MIPKGMADVVAAAARFEAAIDQMVQAMTTHAQATAELAHQVRAHNEATARERRTRTVER